MKVSYNLEKQLKNISYIPPKRYLIFLIVGCIICTLVFAFAIVSSLIKKDRLTTKQNKITSNNDSTDDDYFNRRQMFNMSKLGEIIFLNKPYLKSRSKLFNILIWKEGPFLERRHLNYFTKERHDPFETCSVNNCNITYDSDELENVDAVLFYLQKFKTSKDIPQRHLQSYSQRWIFLTDQSPFNTFQYRKENDWRNYSNIFNWSMTYKIESDVPIPYGRTISILQDTQNQADKTKLNIENFIPNINKKQRGVLIATKPSDCIPNKKRMIYVTELQKYLDVDIYGKCATNPEDLCPSLSGMDCGKLDTYLFYLSFENSNCDQFMTENLYWAAYSKGAIPIIMGPTIENCEGLLPPQSYLHVENFTDPSVLADYILHLNDTWNENYMKYHEWRRSFKVVNEHGYYGTPSKYYCRICEALNYNDENPKVYTHLTKFLSIEDNCRN